TRARAFNTPLRQVRGTIPGALPAPAARLSPAMPQSKTATYLLPHAHRKVRALRLPRGILLQVVHDLGNRFVELRVVASVHFGRPLLHLDVRRHALVFDHPSAILHPDGQVRRRHPPAVQKRREAENTHQPTPLPLPYERAEFLLAEHPRQEVPT